jgi:hypothetical protein
MRFDPAPRTKSAKGTNQIIPVSNTATISLKVSSALIRMGRKPNRNTGAMNSILAWKSRARPVR